MQLDAGTGRCQVWCGEKQRGERLVKVIVKVHASLTGAAFDGGILEVPEASCAGAVLSRLGIADPGEVVVLVDNRAACAQTPLLPGSTLELVPVVEGG